MSQPAIFFVGIAAIDKEESAQMDKMTFLTKCASRMVVISAEKWECLCNLFTQILSMNNIGTQYVKRRSPDQR